MKTQKNQGEPLTGSYKLKLSCMFIVFVIMTVTNVSSQQLAGMHLDFLGKKFPQITAKTLAGNKITLPDAAQGKITLIAMAFKHGTQPQLDSWLKPFEEQFGTKPDYTFYEVPMISTLYIVMSGMIDSGMRGGIPQQKHDNVVTFYGNYKKYRRQLHQDDSTLGYVFLLDRNGFIRWHGKGYATQETLKEMSESAKLLAEGN